MIMLVKCAAIDLREGNLVIAVELDVEPVKVLAFEFAPSVTKAEIRDIVTNVVQLYAEVIGLEIDVPT